jgi:hypothetical protein
LMQEQMISSISSMMKTTLHTSCLSTWTSS